MSSTTIPRAARHHAQPPTAGESRSTTARYDPCATALRSEKITEGHLQRLAIVYVRQSTQQQVLEHRESTARQYALADRAVALGWPAAAVEVIDEDQGRSGSSAEGRSGFQRLLAEVSSDRVGLILGLEMSRLARSCKDWHALLELCAIYRTLLGDADGLYDPSHYNDRLLPGLKGTMSEAELPILKSRLQQGMWNKAERGEVLNHAPIGYVRTIAGDFVIDPDEQVQAVVRLIFAQFTRRGSVNGLLRWLVRHEVKLPVRPHFGENRGDLEWRRPNRVTLLNLLHHPIYAGAYRWGHREVDPRKKVPGRPTTGRTFNAHGACRVLIRDRFPAYIRWEEFEANQHRLAEHSALGKLLSAPRHGPSVLAGLVVCGRCRRHMLVAYGNTTAAAKTLRYSCQRDAIDYGADVCQSLSGAVLESSVTARLLLEQVAVTVEGNTDRVDVELRWAGGFVSRHTLYRPVQTYQQLSNYDELVARIDALPAERKTLSEIAGTLNAEDFHPPKRSPRFTPAILSRFLRERGVRTGSLPRSVTDEQHLRANEWWLADLAAELSMPIATLHRWQRVGWVTSRKVTQAGGRWAIYADADELLRLRRLRDSPRGWPQPYPTELITPKLEPEETVIGA